MYINPTGKADVVAGQANENHTVIEHGLQEGDEVYLSLPENPSKFKVTR
jgi:hypothetical protein